MEAKVNSARLWLFRVLVIVGAGVMLVAWFMPWWTIDIEQLGQDIIQIRPWGLQVSESLGSFEILLKGTEMPAWFGPFMWAYLTVCMIALLVALLILGKEIRVGKFNLARLFSIGKFRVSLSRLLVGGVGFSYIVVGVVAAVYAQMRMGAMYQVPLQGRVLIDLGEPIITFVDTRLLTGYYLIYVAAVLLLVLALLQDTIIGQPKPALPESQGMGKLRPTGV